MTSAQQLTTSTDCRAWGCTNAATSTAKGGPFKGLCDEHAAELRRKMSDAQKRANAEGRRPKRLKSKKDITVNPYVTATVNPYVTATVNPYVTAVLLERPDETVERLHTTGAKVYLAGPMRGLRSLNFPAFHAAAEDLRARGYEVWSPAEADEQLDGFNPETDEPRPFAHYMERDLPAVCRAELVVVLPGWQRSQGARLEVHVATVLGKPVLSYPDLVPARHPSSQRIHELLALAGETHDRKQADYGTDSDPFANVRASEAFGVPAWVGCMIRGNDKMKRLQTMAVKGELANEAAEDSFLDLAVYALIGRVLFEESNGKSRVNAEPV